jgi:hypothetical protein
MQDPRALTFAEVIDEVAAAAGRRQPNTGNSAPPARCAMPNTRNGRLSAHDASSG